MRPQAVALTELVMGKLNTLHEQAKRDDSAFWTVKRTADEVRQLIGPVFCKEVDRIAPEVLPGPTESLSLEQYDRACRVALQRHARALGRETVIFDPQQTIVVPQADGAIQVDAAPPPAVSDAPTEKPSGKGWKQWFKRLFRM